eukprot:CAMPEP_0170755170 /NCGR_PEP_ID=MMETSP0437-20130122/13379_1 /TAXON_ID=0 /ORGANISM="Sexangularia sp." /LENGTH=783 /DNA_ID=CAMNT_0011094329 /DNA_START=23 /DNA_END=2374 /DNA_ORIENTATION=-
MPTLSSCSLVRRRKGATERDRAKERAKDWARHGGQPGKIDTSSSLLTYPDAILMVFGHHLLLVPLPQRLVSALQKSWNSDGRQGWADWLTAGRHATAAPPSHTPPLLLTITIRLPRAVLHKTITISALATTESATQAIAAALGIAAAGSTLLLRSPTGTPTVGLPRDCPFLPLLLSTHTCSPQSLVRSCLTGVWEVDDTATSGRAGAPLDAREWLLAEVWPEAEASGDTELEHARSLDRRQGTLRAARGPAHFVGSMLGQLPRSRAASRRLVHHLGPETVLQGAPDSVIRLGELFVELPSRPARDLALQALARAMAAPPALYCEPCASLLDLSLLPDPTLRGILSTPDGRLVRFAILGPGHLALYAAEPAKGAPQPALSLSHLSPHTTVATLIDSTSFDLLSPALPRKMTFLSQVAPEWVRLLNAEIVEQAREDEEVQAEALEAVRGGGGSFGDDDRSPSPTAVHNAGVGGAGSGRASEVAEGQHVLSVAELWPHCVSEGADGTLAVDLTGDSTSLRGLQSRTASGLVVTEAVLVDARLPRHAAPLPIGALPDKEHLQGGAVVLQAGTSASFVPPSTAAELADCAVRLVATDATSLEGFVSGSAVHSGPALLHSRGIPTLTGLVNCDALAAALAEAASLSFHLHVVRGEGGAVRVLAVVPGGANEDARDIFSIRAAAPSRQAHTSGPTLVAPKPLSPAAARSAARAVRRSYLPARAPSPDTVGVRPSSPFAAARPSLALSVLAADDGSSSSSSSDEEGSFESGSSTTSTPPPPPPPESDTDSA